MYIHVYVPRCASSYPYMHTYLLERMLDGGLSRLRFVCFLRVGFSGCTIEVQGSCGLICLDGWIQLRCPGLIGTYVRNLKVLFDLLLDDFYSQVLRRTHSTSEGGACSLSQRRACEGLESSQQRRPTPKHQDTRKLCRGTSEGADDAACSSLSLGLFSGAEGKSLRTEISRIVKRLVEFEGHRL